MWKIGERIGDKEGRMDVCVAAAGLLSSTATTGLDFTSENFQKVRHCVRPRKSSRSGCSFRVSWQVMNVNTSGVLFTAQAAGKQMLRFGNGGSIVLIGSICGSIALEVRTPCVVLLSFKFHPPESGSSLRR